MLLAIAGQARAENASADDAAVEAGEAPAASEDEGNEDVAERSVSAPAELDAGRYAVRLRDLETRINMLQEQIYRSKARLSLLAESVISGVIGGSKAIIVHRNDLGRSFRLTRAVFALDGSPIFSRTNDEGGLDDEEEFELFNGAVVPGEHTLSVNLEYRGHGYGIFSYLKGYRFKVRSSHAFTAGEGKLIQLRVVAYEKGGPTTPLEDRPDVRYVERVDAVSSANSAGVTGGGEGEEEGE